jgi:hypothetical protein
MRDAPRQANLCNFVFDGSCASFIYTVEAVSVQPMLAAAGENRVGFKDAWHPMLIADRLHFSAF